uniref:Putative secreted protein n=1 Tax=Anopheles darlingi TaxID=43151 RepID=A0A2M4DAI7_ANODA
MCWAVLFFCCCFVCISWQCCSGQSQPLPHRTELETGHGAENWAAGNELFVFIRCTRDAAVNVWRGAMGLVWK